MHRWNTAWAVGFGVAAAGQLTLALSETKPLGTFDLDYRDMMYVGAAKATIGVAARLVLPLHVTVPAPTGDACGGLTALRGALADAGRRERRTFWLTIIGGTALNVAGALVLWHRRDFPTGAISFVTALPIAPISSLTQPRTSWRGTWTVAFTGDSLWLAREL